MKKSYQSLFFYKSTSHVDHSDDTLIRHGFGLYTIIYTFFFDQTQLYVHCDIRSIKHEKVI